jgi:hypothetical protein
MSDAPAIPVEPGEALVREEFALLERTAAAQSPGLLTLLQVYGGYEEALQQVDAYFDIVNQPLGFSTSNSSAG